VGSATADIAFHRAYDILLGWPGVFLQQCGRRHYHARDAVSALHRAGFDKRLLKRMKPPALLYALYCRYLLADRITDFHTAGPHGAAVDQNGAGAALPFSAPVFGTGHIEVVAQDREQTAVGICLNAIFFSVDLKLQSLHETPLEMGW
jgi:hypothetical protein